MTEEIIIAGFGGQGVLSMGKIMAYSGVMQDMEVSWMPSYGPEMRGGTANVIVILSGERISSPIIRHFDTGIILNQQSLDKFEDAIKPGGVLIYDGNGITRHPVRKDISIYRVDATEEAAKMNSPRTFNMIVLGGFLKIKPVLSTVNVIEGLRKSLPERYHKLIPENEKALARGGEIVQEIQKL
ncbi:MAG: 2-oxoacid:acceptor oxidoreductase family protein [Bacteroidales bacterium]|jgi:2-oxoglutarate ferredoxin oxidoreductase subunit gamma|nr:2-oxoacid:acceptor oxidoreductase family protein [Bacteroidales bacterium]